MRPTLLALGLALGLGGTAFAHADTTPPSQPPLTALTKDSGTPEPAEQKRVHFDHAELHIAVHPDTQSIDGKATLTFSALEATDVLMVDLDRNLPVSAISVDGHALAASAWSNPEGRLRIQLPQAVAKGSKVSATITYGGKPHVAKKAPWDGGFVWSHTKDGQPWVGSAVEGEGCDLFWPCVDQPDGKPDLVDLYVNVPKPLVAPGNGVLVGVSDEGSTSTYHWRAKHPTTYAISINVGPYKELTGEYKSRYGNTIPLQYWYMSGEEKQAKALFAEFPRMLEFFEAKVGPYPWGDEKMGVVETPYEGMEHQTINAYGNNYAKDGTGFDWLLQHEFSHEWFGNQMTNANWDDMWLHEGFATLMQPLYAQYLDGDAEYYAWINRLRMMIANRYPVVSGTQRTEEAVYDESRGGPGQDIYNKGALMLQTLQHLIGDKAFYDSTRELVYGRPDPKPGNFQPQYRTTADFMRIVNQVTGKNYDWFFKVYLYQAALPKLDVQRHGDTLDLTWQAPDKLPFPMPVEVQVDDTVHTVAMDGGHGSLAVPASALVTIDPHSVLLRDEPRITEFQQWMKQQRAQHKGAKQ
ncbi:M1 family metallopeptidase [Rhodanobacter sp. DHG33]|uniref:M1 family metallopeptidase n=1 Tax=Rhodanobacter sp. DHG33 TaxID=2775921 RepID=UPI001780F389|nr:M1 family metallopeptidase [Rhodanobacter sp. DHG33]MBD8899068.1 M1 family metallopeptidase [Rhodanobacter sp. DHG33]